MKALLRRLFGKHKDASAIGIIGSADGPTVVCLGRAHDSSRWQKTLEKCKQAAEPRQAPVTGEELVRYLIEEYGAFEVPVSRSCRQTLRMNALMNHHSEVWSQPPLPPRNAGRRVWQEWARQARMDIAAVRDIEDERYGFKYKCLALPFTERTARYYAEADSERANVRRGRRRAERKAPHKKRKKIVFAIELTTGYCQLDNGCKSLMDEVTLWRGVTQQDIDNETAAFMAYAAAMRDAGRLNG